MAALALPTSRLSTRLFGWSAPSWLAAAAVLPASLGASGPSSWRTIPTALQSLLELFPPIDMAVPKKKTSHSRKAMRSANKGLHDKRNLVHCPGCGSPKLAHHLCPICYSSLSRGWKAVAKQVGKVFGAGPPAL